MDISGIVDPWANTPVDPDNFTSIAGRLMRTTFTASGHWTLLRFQESFWQWSGRRYKIMRDEELRNDIRRFLNKAQVLDKKGNHVPFNPSKKDIEEVFAALATVVELRTDALPPMWKTYKMDDRPANELFAVANGLLHLPTRTLTPHTPRFFNLSCCEGEYDPGAMCLTFDTYCASNIGDRECIELMQDWFGYLISGDMRQHKILLAYGQPRSGRSTFGAICEALCGKESVGWPSSDSIAKNFGLQNLVDKTVAIIADFGASRHMNAGSFQETVRRISGCDPVHVDRKHKSPIDVRLPVRLQFHTNQLYSVMADNTGALVKRYVILSFPNTFYGKEDVELPQRLLKEMSGILNWALIGYDRMQTRRRFVQPDSVKSLLAEMEVIGNPAKAFVLGCCIIEAGRSVSKDALYSAWCNWCQENNRMPGGKAWFSRNLFEAYPQVSDNREGGEPRYEGIGFNDKLAPKTA